MISIALVHYPIVDKHGTLQSSSITTFDIHDLSRSGRTYGIDRLYLVHPSPLQRGVAERILGYWNVGGGRQYNACRSEALENTETLATLELAIEHMTQRAGKKPIIIATSAKSGNDRITFEECRKLLAEPVMLILGTGWGLAPQVFDLCDHILEPINGPTEFNHLSVRAAGAIILDRLLGR
jgi:hypothetical protein